MRWIESLVECTEKEARSRVRFSSEHFGVADGGVLESALVECMAQTVAAALGFHSRKAAPGSTPAMGMLAAVSNFKIHAKTPLDKTLEITVKEIKRLGPMRLVLGTIRFEEQLIASGQLSLYA
jgi:predicted hotdog family 3-hydroxylacyl-ACP dehydratase